MTRDAGRVGWPFGAMRWSWCIMRHAATSSLQVSRPASAGWQRPPKQRRSGQRPRARAEGIYTLTHDSVAVSADPGACGQAGGRGLARQARAGPVACRPNGGGVAWPVRCAHSRKVQVSSYLNHGARHSGQIGFRCRPCRWSVRSVCCNKRPVGTPSGLRSGRATETPAAARRRHRRCSGAPNVKAIVACAGLVFDCK